MMIARGSPVEMAWRKTRSLRAELIPGLTFFADVYAGEPATLPDWPQRRPVSGHPAVMTR